MVELFRQKQQAKLWHDYGPTLAAEELAEDHGIRVNRETLRQWLIEAISDHGHEGCKWSMIKEEGSADAKACALD